jgi:prepilin-type N-terminal cleavage/methylation domain-containing protein
MHEGFSLIELLLVIFIVSLVYFLGFSTVKNEKKSPKPLSVKNIKSAIIQAGLKEGTLICTKQCEQCFFRKSINTSFEPYKGKIDLKGLKVYTIDAQETLVRDEPGHFKHEKICLQIHFYPNGSSTPLVIENSQGIYFLPAYFGEPQKVKSLEEAEVLWLEQYNTLKQSGAIY